MVDAAIVKSFENIYFALNFKVGKVNIQRYCVFIWLFLRETITGNQILSLYAYAWQIMGV